MKAELVLHPNKWVQETIDGNDGIVMVKNETFCRKNTWIRQNVSQFYGNLEGPENVCTYCMPRFRSSGKWLRKIHELVNY